MMKINHRFFSARFFWYFRPDSCGIQTLLFGTIFCGFFWRQRCPCGAIDTGLRRYDDLKSQELSLQTKQSIGNRHPALRPPLWPEGNLVRVPDINDVRKIRSPTTPHRHPDEGRGPLPRRDKRPPRHFVPPLHRRGTKKTSALRASLFTWILGTPPTKSQDFAGPGRRYDGGVWFGC